MQRAGLIHMPGSTKDRSADAAFSRQPRNQLLSPSHAQHSLITSQRPIGNQAMLRMLPQPSAEALALVGRGPSWSFSRIPIHPPEPSAAAERPLVSDVSAPPDVQPKLQVDAVDDPLEHEADRIADRVMRMPEKSLWGETRNSALGSRNHSSAPGIPHEVLGSPGHPLDATSRSFMQSRFGHDFSKIRVHWDARAAGSAQDVNTRAYR